LREISSGCDVDTTATCVERFFGKRYAEILKHLDALDPFFIRYYKDFSMYTDIYVDDKPSDL